MITIKVILTNDSTGQSGEIEGKVDQAMIDDLGHREALIVTVDDIREKLLQVPKEFFVNNLIIK